MQSNPKNGGTPDPAKLEVHPAADLFPLIEGAEFEELVEDIRANGLKTPILLDANGRVLDGRNRLRACHAAGIEPRFETWDGRGSPLEAVVSLNLRRRHLNESQRAMLAAQMRDLMATEAGTNWSPGKSADRAALIMNISPMSVKRASQVLRSGDESIIYLVRKGDLAVSAAAEKLQQKSAPEPAATTPQGRFPIVYAAPRWERQKFEKLAARSVSEIAADDAVLFLRAPDHALADATDLIKRWGFCYQASIALWRKPRTGRYTLSQYDLVLIATRGRAPSPSSTHDSLAAEALELTQIIETMFPGQPHADALRPRAATKD